MPPKRFCQLCSRLTRRRKTKRRDFKKSAALSESLSRILLRRPAWCTAKSRRLGSHLLYIRRCPITRTQHLNKTTALVAKKRISHPSWLLLACRLEVSAACDIIAVDSRERETLFAPSIITPGTNIWARRPAKNKAAKVAIVSQQEMTNQVCWVKTSSYTRGFLFRK